MEQPDAPTLALASGSFVLRPYQREAVDAGIACLTGKKDINGLIVLPTGSGKSLVCAVLAKELNAPVLILQPSKEILEQNVGKFRSYGGHAGIYSASVGEKRMSDVTFATIGSVINKKHLLERFQYLIIDECDLVSAQGGMYEELITHMGRRVLGMTATPYRLSSGTNQVTFIKYSILKFLTRTNPRVFNKVVYHVQNKTLSDAGYWAKYDYREVKAINRQNLQPNSTGNDYSDASIRAEYKANNFPDHVARVVRRVFHPDKPRKNCLVFTRDVAEAMYVVSNVPGCAIVTAKSKPKERERIITGFRTGRIRCVVNVGILTVGFDYPELEAIVMARPTRSLRLWYQIVGRGARPHPDKKDCLVVDMGGNLAQFGKVEDLELREDGGWHVYGTGVGRQLTQVPFGDAPMRRS
jgi:DNA repair protein RadD